MLVLMLYAIVFNSATKNAAMLLSGNQAQKEVIIRELRAQPSSEKLLQQMVISRPTTRQCTGTERRGTHSPKWNVSIKLFPQGLRDLCGRGSGEIVRTRGDG